MPQFSKKSLRHLDQLDARMQEILREAIKHVDFSIISSHRDQAEQNRLVSIGVSKTPWPESRHNASPAQAVDLAPYFDAKPHIDWNDKEGFIYLAGIVKGIAWTQNTPLRWGGDWDNDNDQRDENFRDLGHFELVT